LDAGDLCLATEEVFGDLGRCTAGGVVPIEVEGEEVPERFPLDEGHRRLGGALDAAAPKTGRLVTVSCASGTPERAAALGRRFRALAENMEGAAAALACRAAGACLVELRAVSNVAGEPDRARWRVREALEALAPAAAAALEALAPAAEVRTGG
ncbi:futalosine hydrolase, partial [Dissulfurirhabdus thermomarina]|nr:futalosine hydrolase [Dissulfurirhabdus thermomarina]